jgi:large repetitive protein
MRQATLFALLTPLALGACSGGGGGDTPPGPEISAVTIVVQQTTATVTWTTSQPATSEFEYGLTNAYGSNMLSATLVTAHQVDLTLLTAGTPYFFKITSVNGSGIARESTGMLSTDPAAFETDGFNACGGLDAIWTVIDPIGDSTVSAAGPGTASALMEIAVPGGVNHDAFHTNEAPRVMQASLDIDFEIEVKFDSEPMLQAQIQGVLIEQDAARWLRFDFVSTSGGLFLFAGSTIANATTVRSNLGIASNPTLYMRVTRVGDLWTQTYSFDGTLWLPGTSFVDVLTVGSAGVFSGNAGAPSPAFTARVDYFYNTAQAGPPVDGATGGQTPFTLDVTVPGGNGIVQRSITQPVYSCMETVTLTALPDLGFAFDSWAGDLNGSAIIETILMDANRVVMANFIVDVLPPVISNVNVALTDVAATISWTTNEPATSEVDYGLDALYGTNVNNGLNLSLSHSLDLLGLTPETLHHFQITSADALMQSASTADMTFTTAEGIESDDFNACAGLRAEWNFIDPVGDSSFVVGGQGTDDARLSITVPALSSHDPFGDNDSARVMQPTSDNDFELEVKFDSEPTMASQMQGIIAEQDDLVGLFWLRFDFVYTDGALRAFAGYTVGGATYARANVPIPSFNPMWLRVNRTGNTWTQSYSSDGVMFTDVVTFDEAIDITSVGVFAGNASLPEPGFTAEVDYFFNTLVPIVPEDGPIIGPAPRTLTVGTTGMGSVTEDPSLALYYCSEIVTLTAVPDPGWVFDSWAGDVTGMTNPETVVLDADRNVTALFILVPPPMPMVAGDPPAIEHLSVDAGVNEATVRWTTDFAATSRVRFGRADVLDGLVENGDLLERHALTLSGLLPRTTYHYRVESVDAFGRIGASRVRSFRTR